MIDQAVAPCQPGLSALGQAPRISGDAVEHGLVPSQRLAAHGVELQRAAVIWHGLGKAGLGAVVGERQQPPHRAQLGKLVGQQLVKKQQIGFELARLGQALHRQLAGQPGRAHAVGRRQMVGDGQVARHLAVAASGRGDVVAGLRQTGHRAGQQRLAQPGLQQAAGAGPGGGVVDAQAAPLEPQIRAGAIKTGAALGVNGQQPIAAEAAVAQKAQALDGQHAGHGHQHLDQVGQAQRAAALHSRPFGRIEKPAGQQRAFKNLVNPPAPAQHLAQRAERHVRRQVAGQRLVDAGQQLGLVDAGRDLECAVQRHRLDVLHADRVDVLAQAAPGQQALRGAAHQRGAVDVLTQAGFLDAHPDQAARPQRGDVRAGVGLLRAAAAAVAAVAAAAVAVILASQRQRPQHAPGAVVVGQWLVHRLDPGIAHAGDVAHQLAQIRQGDRCAGQHLGRREQARRARAGAAAGDRVAVAGQQVLHREIGAVGQIGEGVAQRLQQRDAGVVGVVVGPGGASQALQQAEAAAAQRVEGQRLGHARQRRRRGVGSVQRVSAWVHRRSLVAGAGAPVKPGAVCAAPRLPAPPPIHPRYHPHPRPRHPRTPAARQSAPAAA